MNWIMTTKLLLIAVTVILILYDVVAAFKGGVVSTISWQIFSNAVRYPIIPFAFGLLFGHLFWLQVFPPGTCP